VYDAPEDDAALRVLVDRLWPRGIGKQDPRVDRWCKAVAPSTELRRWYGHRPELFAEFGLRYREELTDDGHRDALRALVELARERPVTLVTATKEIELGHVVVLAEVVGEAPAG